MYETVESKKMKLLILAISVSISLPQLAHSADRSVIVRFKQRPGGAERLMVRRAKGKVRRSHLLVPAMTVVLPEEKIAELRKDRRVAYVEENAIYTMAATRPAANELDNAWGVRHIAADVAHAKGYKGAGIRVAILDSGIDYTQPELDGNYVGGYDFVFNDSDPFDDNFASHGTHVAGIIAAEGNGTGVIGVAPHAQILAVKVLDGAGFGTLDWVIAGIEWAVLNGAQIINLSVQGPDQQSLQEACDAARDAGVLLVAAGGNSVAGEGPVLYPAAYDSVIAVTATDPIDLPADYSPVGAALELSAPGVNIYSTVAGSSFAKLSGTSQAAPFVTGAAALYMAANTFDLTGDGLVDGEDTRWLLQLSATDLGAAGRDPIFGCGLVHASLSEFGDRALRYRRRGSVRP